MFCLWKIYGHKIDQCDHEKNQLRGYTSRNHEDVGQAKNREQVVKEGKSSIIKEKSTVKFRPYNGEHACSYGNPLWCF